MKISVLVVGRVRGPLKSAVQEFEMRAARYWKLNVVEIESARRSYQAGIAVINATTEMTDHLLDLLT